jgi:hypothetical protein
MPFWPRGGRAAQQQPAEAAALHRVDHRDGRLGGVRAVAVAHVARDAEALAGLGVERPIASWSMWSISVKNDRLARAELALTPMKRR